MVQREGSFGLKKRMMIPGPRTQTTRHVLHDIVDERTDYTDMSAEQLIGDAPTSDDSDAYTQDKATAVNLLANARVKTKTKKAKASVRIVAKPKRPVDHNTQPFPTAVDGPDAGADEVFDLELDFDMFSDLDEVLEFEDDGEWEHVEAEAKAVRFADDRPSYALVVKVGG